MAGLCSAALTDVSSLSVRTWKTGLYVSRQSTMAFRTNSTNFYVKECLLFLRNAWLDSGFMFCVSSG